MIELKIANAYGGSTILKYPTNREGECSFQLYVPRGQYTLSFSYDYYDIEKGEHLKRTHNKTITVKKSNEPYFNEKLVNKYSDYVVRDKDIYVDMDSFNYETLMGTDDEGNNYTWWAGEWFRTADLNSGLINPWYGED